MANTITPSSPYYLGSGDNPRTSISGYLLEGDNYPTWQRSMINALNAKNKVGFIDGTLTKPTEDADMQQAREKNNSMIISWIFHALAPELKRSVAYATTAKDLWTNLKERFGQGNAPRIHELKREITLLQQNSMTVLEYFTKLKELWEELGNYSSNPGCTCGGCTCGAAKELSAERENEKVHNFLMGLNENLGVIRSQILNMEPLPTLKKAYVLVIKEEKQKSVANGRITNQDATALATRFNRNKEEKKKNKCTHCGKLGHFSEDCFTIKGYPEWWQGSKPTGGDKTPQTPKFRMANSSTTDGVKKEITSPNLSLTQKQYDQLISLLVEKQQHEHHVNFAGNISHNPIDWILDSGATDHMTSAGAPLSNLRPAPTNLPVKLPDGNTLNVYAFGDTN